MWLLYAILSAVFASFTAVLAKIGIKGINSNLATAIRTIVILLMSWGMVFISGAQSGLSSLTKQNWIFLILSGLATGASWLFYYKALQIGEVSQVAPIDKLSIVLTLILAFVVFKDPISAKRILGCICVVGGIILLI